MQAKDIIEKYITFFEKRQHKRIANAPLVPQNDPTTLFTSSGMQPLIPYLLGEPHPQGRRLVNVQNCFRAQDIDEVGDNRHTTFFRMLGNWSLGDYFKQEQLLWFFEFLTKELQLPPEKLYVSVFAGFNDMQKDEEAANIWRGLFTSVGIDPKNRIFFYGTSKNWWSRVGEPENMPTGEPGGPDSEVFFDFGTLHDTKYGQTCNPNCQCGRFMEIGNSVFMQYQKNDSGSFTELPQKNVDFGGGLERILAAVENKQDVFQTSLFTPIVKTLEMQTLNSYETQNREMRIIIDHLIAAAFMITNNVTPSNTEQGYVLRRLIRRGIDNFDESAGKNFYDILETIVLQYKDTSPELETNFEKIRFTITEEDQIYRKTKERAKAYIVKKYPKKQGDELKGVTEISSGDAFALYSTHGLSPIQIKSLGYIFDEKAFAKKMEDHQELSRLGAAQKFAGGLADNQERTVMGHTATHLLHQALRDMFGKTLHQTGSNITAERLRFDFNFDRKLTDEEINKLEEVINEKIKENLPVSFDMIPTEKAKQMDAIGLFEDTYADISKIYFIGGSSQNPTESYSIEFCGGPHVDFTGKIKKVKIIKQENIGHGQRRLYAAVDN